MTHPPQSLDDDWDKILCGLVPELYTIPKDFDYRPYSIPDAKKALLKAIELRLEKLAYIDSEQDLVINWEDIKQLLGGSDGGK